MDKSIKHRAKSIIAVAIQEGVFENAGIQFLQEVFSQYGQSLLQVIVTDLFANSFPNMFLRVQIRAGCWKVDDL